MSAMTQRALRIGEVAEQTGLTPRTIRYYEEIGLLGTGEAREQGRHRLYTASDVQRISEIVRLRNLLGVTLEQLAKLLEAESARAELRREYHEADDPGRRRQILEQSLPHIDTQLELVRTRHREIEQLEHELNERRELVLQRLAELV